MDHFMTEFVRDLFLLNVQSKSVVYIRVLRMLCLRNYSFRDRMNRSIKVFVDRVRNTNELSTRYL